MIIEKSDILIWLNEEFMNLNFKDWLDFISAGTRFATDERDLIIRLAKYYKVTVKDLQEEEG